MSSDEPDPVQQQAETPTEGARQSSGGPFDAAPRHLPAAGKGCSRMALAGCGLVALVLGLGVLTMMLKATDIVSWSLSRIRVEVERTLPVDLPDADRQRLGLAFDAALQRIDGGGLDPVAFQALQGELLQFARRSRPPTVEEVRELTDSLEAFAAVGSPEPQPSSEETDSRVARSMSR